MSYYNDAGNIDLSAVATELIRVGNDREKATDRLVLEQLLEGIDLDVILAAVVGKGPADYDFSADITADQITNADITAAAVFWHYKLVERFGPEITVVLHARIAQRIYVNGYVHQGNSKGMMISSIEDGILDARDSGHELQALIDSLLDVFDNNDEDSEEYVNALSVRDMLSEGISVGDYRKWYDESKTKDAISKTMILRIYRHALYHIHNVESVKPKTVIARNVFMTSLEKCEYDLTKMTIPGSLRYFGANHHPEFAMRSVEERKSYYDAREAIFKYSKGEGRAQGVNRGV